MVVAVCLFVLPSSPDEMIVATVHFWIRSRVQPRILSLHSLNISIFLLLQFLRPQTVMIHYLLEGWPPTFILFHHRQNQVSQLDAVKLPQIFLSVSYTICG